MPQLPDYFVCMQEVAAEESIAFIDLYNYTEKIYNSWGDKT